MNSRNQLTFPQDEPLIREVRQRLHRHHLGKDNAVTGAKIVAGLKAIGFRRATEEKLRAITNYLNSIEVEVASCVNGYFFAETDEEITEYIDSLEGRVRGINNRVKGLRKRLEHKHERAEHGTV